MWSKRVVAFSVPKDADRQCRLAALPELTLVSIMRERQKKKWGMVANYEI